MISSRTFPEHILLLCFLCCLCLLISCDMIYKRQVIIDFRNDRAKTFTVSKPEDLDNLFSRIEKIAKRNGLTCKPYNTIQKYRDCFHERVRLAISVKGETTVSIALTQFGPRDKTEQFKALEKDLSDFIKEEFPGKTLK